MKVVEIMRQSCAQMGRLYSGYFVRLEHNVIQDQHLRMNKDDFTGGTLFLADPVLQSYIVKETTQDGKLTYQLYEPRYIPYEGNPILPVLFVADNPPLPVTESYSVTTIDRSTLISALNTALISMGEHTAYKDIEVIATSDGDLLLPTEITSPKKIERYHDSYKAKLYSTYDFSIIVQNNQPVVRISNRVAPLEKVQLRVWYNQPHPYVHDDQDEIHDDYHTRRLVYEVAYHAYFQALAKEQNSSDKDLLMFQTLMQERQALASKHPVPRITSTIILPRN